MKKKSVAKKMVMKKEAMLKVKKADMKQDKKMVKKAVKKMGKKAGY